MEPSVLTVVFIVLLALALYWAYQTFVVQPRKEVFAKGGLVLKIDASGRLSVESDNGLDDADFPLGALQFELARETRTKVTEKYHPPQPGKVYRDALDNGTIHPPQDGWTQTIHTQTPTGWTLLHIDEREMPYFFYQKWAVDNPDAKWRYGSERTTFKVPNRSVPALSRWLKAHRQALEPNESLLRKKWVEESSKAIKASQKHPAFQRLENPIELFEVDANLNVKHLALGQGGEVLLKTMQGPEIHELNSQHLSGEGNTLTVKHPGGWHQTFKLDDKQIKAVNHLRRSWKKRALC